MSDRIAVMSHGRIEQLDRPQEIYDRPATAFVAGFIGDMNFLEGEVVEADGDRWSAAIGPLLIRGLGEARRGAAVRIGVRPENVVIEPGSVSAGEANRAGATLVAAMILGDQVQLIAELPGGRQIVAREQRAAAGAVVEQLSPGDAVVVRWSPEAAMLLEELAVPAGGEA
jgi:spermidine/putrescine transport system ATP-binding protein